MINFYVATKLTQATKFDRMVKSLGTVLEVVCLILNFILLQTQKKKKTLNKKFELLKKINKKKKK
jgi:hypothetical protein